MKITFTGITKEEAIYRLDHVAKDMRFHAARIEVKPIFASEAAKEKRRADRLVALADTLRTSDGEVSMSDSDEKLLYLACAQFEHTFDAADAMFTISHEDGDALPLDFILAEGAYQAQKTE